MLTIMLEWKTARVGLDGQPMKISKPTTSTNWKNTHHPVYLEVGNKASFGISKNRGTA